MPRYQKTQRRGLSGCCILSMRNLRKAVCSHRGICLAGKDDGEYGNYLLQKKALRLLPVSLEAAGDSLKVSYQITGGYNDNAVRVSWKASSPEAEPEWIYLKTFTGGYLKYVAEKTLPYGICSGRYGCVCLLR